MEISRREFVKRGLVLISGSMAVPAFFRRTAWAVEAQSGNAGPFANPDNILVLVQLSGGNDGLNTVIPHADPLYVRHRPTLGVARKEILDLDGQIGLHPAMKELHALFGEHRLAVVQGVGYPNPNRSHFRSTDIWMTGNPVKPEGTGWVGRHLDTLTQERPQFPAMAIGHSEEGPLRGVKTAVPTFRTLEEFRVFRNERNEEQRAADLKIFQTLHRRDGGHYAQAEFLQEESMNAFVSSENLRSLVGGYQTRVQYPSHGLAQSLRLVGQMIASGMQTKAYHVSMGGFDTHAEQGGPHASLLAQLSESLSAFTKDLAEMKKAERVVIMTYSEFGRRVAENGSRGTDHGAAAALFVLGEKVSGRIAGTHPSLADLDDGDLKYGVDFRSVYSTLLEQWLGGSSKEVFGLAFQPIPLFG